MDNQQTTANYLFKRIGYWSALACGAGAVAYGVISIIVAMIATSALTWDTYAKYLADYNPLPTIAILTPVFLVTLIFPILILSIYSYASEQRRPFALLALLFAGVYTAILGSAYWMQLTFVPQSILEGNTANLELWILWQPRSFFWSLESFGYFIMGLSGLFAGLSFQGTVSRRIRWGFIAMAPLGLLFMINEYMALWPLASVMPLLLLFSWVILVAFVCFSLARYLKKQY